MDTVGCTACVYSILVVIYILYKALIFYHSFFCECSHLLSNFMMLILKKKKGDWHESNCQKYYGKSIIILCIRDCSGPRKCF